MICIVSLIGMLTYRSFMSSVISLGLSLMLFIFRLCVKNMGLGVLFVLIILIFSCNS